MKQVEPLAGPENAVKDAYTGPVGTAPLAELAAGKKSAVIVISDTTRPVPNETLLVPMLDVLETAGIDKSRIIILIATGIHRPATPEEIVRLVGTRIAGEYNVVNHDAENAGMHRLINTLDDGTPIYIDKRFLKADLKICTGLVELHLMAGFSGGRKSILPGIASLETLKHLHGYRMIQQDTTCYGRLRENPFHHAAVAVARAAGVDFIANVTLDEHHRITGVFCGDLVEAHEQACSFLETYAIVDVPKQADIVVTTGGGFPLDATLYQSLKGLVTALQVVKPGGTVILAAENREGAGSPEFTGFLNRLENPEEFFELSKKQNYIAKDQWMLQELINGLHHCEIMYYTDGMTGEQVRDSFMIPVETVEAGIDAALGRHGNGADILVIPGGPYVLPRPPVTVTGLYSWQT